MSMQDIIEQVTSTNPISHFLVLIATISILLLDASRNAAIIPYFVRIWKKTWEAVIYIIASVIFAISTIVLWIFFILMAFLYLFGFAISIPLGSGKRLSDSKSDLTMNPLSLPMNGMK